MITKNKIFLAVWVSSIMIVVMCTFYEKAPSQVVPKELMTLEIRSIYCVNGFRYFTQGTANTFYIFRNTEGNIVPCVKGEYQ